MMTGAGEIAHLLGGAMLVLALLMLAARRIGAAIGAYALQSGALALAAGAQGWAQDRLWLFVAAVVVLGLQAVLIPAGLRRVAYGLATADRRGPAGMALGVAVVVLTILAVRGAALPAGMAREDLAAALSVTLLGLLAVITRRDREGQVLGFLSAVSGCELAALSLPGFPVLMIALGAALLAIPALGLHLIQVEGPKGPRPLAGPGQSPGLPLS